MENYMNLKFKSISDNESFARIAVASFISQLDPTLEELSDIKTAVSEAVTNCIIHGYNQDQNKEVFINVSIMANCMFNGEDNYFKIYIEVVDSGIGIENIDLVKEPLYTSRPDLERSGMGFTIMESFVDEFEVCSNVNEGTKIKMTKYLKAR